MSKYRITDNSPSFQRNANQAIDRVLSGMAVDIERVSKRLVPVQAGGGGLQGSFRSERMAPGRYRVSYNTAYAAYQERGARRDGSHRVRSYSTPGTGSGFLKRGADAAGRTARSELKRILGNVKA